jgi:4-hydroxyphenylpyruvate dioxygenase
MAPSAISDYSNNEATTLPSDVSSYRGYDHVHWYVGNAKQAASYYITRMGFERIAYRGLETGCRSVCSHVVRNGDITFVLTSPLRSLNQLDRFGPEEQELLREIHAHLERHGDGVKDVAFEVDSVDAVFDAAVSNGARVVSHPKVLEDASGQVKVATIQTFGDTTHTLVERKSYRDGFFLPGYRMETGAKDPVSAFLPAVQLKRIDHCVGNQDWDEMDKVCE